MFATRDQENLVHAHQTTAAGKSLNAGTRALPSKTPGNVKTPFRAVKNDENKLIGFQGPKLGLQDGESKFDKAAFVTPAGPRHRAPLAAKTTNAKAHAFKTPAPVQPTGNADKTNKRASTTRKSAKSKITIAPSEPVQTDVLSIDDDDFVPEPEYAPPPPIELPDPPMDFDYDQTFPQFQGMNMTRGYGEIYCTSPTDERGVSVRLQREQAIRDEYDRKVDQKILDDANCSLAETGDAALERTVEAMIAAGPKRKNNTGLDTVRARSAAVALSQPKFPSAALKETISSTQKSRKAAFAVHNARQPPTASVVPARHALISKTTVGYPKAKKPASIIPRGEQQQQKNRQVTVETQKVDQSAIHPKQFVELYGNPPVESEMWFRLKQYELLETRFRKAEDEEGADKGNELFETDTFREADEEDGGLFQLPLD